MKPRTKLFTGLLALIVIVTCSYGQFVSANSQPAIQGRGMECDKIPPPDNFYSYPIVFDGHILDNADFKIKSQGRLSILQGLPGAANTANIPFYFFLRRNNTIIKQCNVNWLTLPAKSIEISDILSLSKAGDVLIIVPITKPDGETTISVDMGC